MRIEPAAFAALPTIILNDELDVEMVRDIDDRAFRHIYRFDSEDARKKMKNLGKFLRGKKFFEFRIRANVVYTTHRTGYIKQDCAI